MQDNVKNSKLQSGSTKIEKTIESLRKLHENYQEQVNLLTAKKQRVSAALQEATERLAQTFEAIQVLEGNGGMRQLLEKATKDKETIGNTVRELIPEHVAESPTNGNLPPAEPGFEWVKVNGENVLVQTHPDVIDNPVVLPSVPKGAEFEEFDSPESFIAPRRV